MTMKHFYTTFLILFFVSISSNAQQLVAGDIAFIGYHTDTPDGFTWISLTDIPAGEEIYFTEEGWSSLNGGEWYVNNEVHLLWTAPATGLPSGTIVNITEVSTTSFSFTTTAGTTSIASGTSFSLTSGDQVLAYRGGSGVEPAMPVFIAGVNGDYSSGNYNTVTTWGN